MTREELQQFMQAYTEDMKETSRRKNADYTGAGDDPFANFRMVEQAGICTTEQGILVRMNDKMARIATFVKKGVLEVKDESVVDTLKDLSNYAALLCAVIEDKRRDQRQREYEGGGGGTGAFQQSQFSFKPTISKL